MGAKLLTYAQAKNRVQDALAVGRNETTLKEYDSVYQNKIFPLIGNVPLDALTEELCQKAIKTIEDEGYIANGQRNNYGEGTIQKYRFVLYLVIREAAKENLCTDFLWGTLFSMSPEKYENMREEVRRNSQGLIRKSLTVEEEKQIVEILLENPVCEGEKVGLILMFGLGLRNSEACGASFADIVSIAPNSNLKALRVWETTEGNTDNLRVGGKTGNMSRLVPIPTHIARFLEQRFQALSANLTEEVGKLPIACRGSRYSERLNRDQLSAAARQLFRDINMKKREVIMLEMDESIKRAWGEKEPTAYLFRRNFATHLCVLGLEIEEIEYLMGHKITGRYEIRSDFGNPDLLLQIAEKMQYRPLVNDISDIARICLDTGEEYHGELPIGGRLELTLPEGISRVSVMSNEPGETVELHICEGAKQQLSTYIHAELFKPERILDSLVSYRARYENLLIHRTSTSKPPSSTREDSADL